MCTGIVYPLACSELLQFCLTYCKGQLHREGVRSGPFLCFGKVSLVIMSLVSWGFFCLFALAFVLQVGVFK